MNRQLLVLLLVLLLAACGEKFDESYQADQALDQMREFYEKALEKAPDDPVAWAKEDIQRFGDWEYRVTSIPPSLIAELEVKLNELGRDRWEAFWVREERGGVVVLLKRPAKSYLRTMPFSEIGKALSGDGAPE